MDINRELLGWLGGASLGMLLVSAIIVPMLVIRMQQDYFLDGRDEQLSMKKRHPFLRVSGLVLKNIAGGLLVIAGIIMTVAPGQGLLTVLIGLALMDFPRKRELEIWLIKRKPVNWAIAKLREKANRPPLLLPAE